MAISRLCHAAVVLSFLCVCQLAVADDPAGVNRKQPWTAETCFHVKNVGQVQPSPDGKRVIYTVTETVLEAKGASEKTRLYLANADGTGATPLTPDKSRPSQPQWSADGAWIQRSARVS
jgi:dipeptidyl aminopeptidase/acylaminoacyl peptidase